MILPMRSEKPGCAGGICGGETPPLIGSVLTGTGLTLAQAAAALERGERPPLTPVQERLVDAWATEQALHPARG